MMGKCLRCGETTRVGGVGHPQRYCSAACKQAAYRARRLPDEMTSRPRWVRRFGKRPVTVSGWAALVTNPDTWATYAEARAAKVGDGIGYVLGDGIGCLDLDHVIDSDGRLDPRAAELLATLPATYTEVSPSGDGLHVFGRVPERPGRARKVNGVSVETYSVGRYMTVTGRRWQDAPATLADISAALEW